MKTCKQCRKEKNCKYLCEDMSLVLKNSLKNNNLYSEKYHRFKSRTFEEGTLDFNIYTYGLSASEERAVKRVIIAILPKLDIEILKLHGDGMFQEDIAKKLHISQPTVSFRLKKIKKSILEKSFNKIIDYLI